MLSNSLGWSPEDQYADKRNKGLEASELKHGKMSTI